MGIEERKLREKEERHALIIENAKKLIIEHGVDYLTMQTLAEISELSKATLYLYFENKDAILMEILENAASDFVNFARSRIPGGSSGLQSLHALWMSYLKLFGESQDIIVLTGIKNYIDPQFPLGSEEGGSRFGSAMGEMLALIVEVLRKGVSDGSLEKIPDPERLAYTIIMIATSIIDSETRLPRLQRDPRKISLAIRETFEILLRGLAAEGSDRSLLTLTAL